MVIYNCSKSIIIICVLGGKDLSKASTKACETLLGVITDTYNSIKGKYYKYFEPLLGDNTYSWNLAFPECCQFLLFIKNPIPCSEIAICNS